MKQIHTILARLSWTSRRLWQQTDSLGLVIFALVVLVIGLQWQVLAPLSKQLAQADQELLQSQHRLEALRQQVSVSTISSASQSPTEAFLAFLPPYIERNKQLQTVQQLADKQAVTLSRLDYQSTTVTVLPVNHLTIRFSVQGEDKQLAVFLNLLLRQLPNLAIDRLSLDKKDPLLNQSQLTIEASLFLRAEGQS